MDKYAISRIADFLEKIQDASDETGVHLLPLGQTGTSLSVDNETAIANLYLTIEPYGLNENEACDKGWNYGVEIITP